MNKLNKKNSMCWLTALNYVKRNKKAGYILSSDDIKIEDLKNLPDGIYSVEIEITDINSEKKKKGYFFPRMFMHAFNIDKRGSLNFILQSWFLEFPFTLYKTFNNESFKKWIDELNKRVMNFNNEPIELFSFFGYKSFEKIEKVAEHLEKPRELEYRIQIFY